MSKPFFQKEFTFTNPDGSKFQSLGWGNQFYAVFETLDGFTIVQNPADGYYEYAKLSDDKNDLVPSGVRVSEVSRRPTGLPQHLRIRHETTQRKAQQVLMQLGGQPRWLTRWQQRQAQTRQALMAGPLGAPPTGHTVGSYVGLCLLVQFPDVSGAIPQNQVDNFCNKQGYNLDGNNGSVYDYFYDNSDGKLYYTNIVTTYYTAKHNRAYYTDRTIAYGTRARELIIEGLDYLKAQAFDFSRLSSDSDGYIYALNIFYAGDIVNNWSEGLWPHSWTLATPYQAATGKRFADYQITNMGTQLTLGTFCHENGHMICDFPDLYDYGYQSCGVGNYCLMCYGGADTNPTQVGAYLKYKAGWTTRVTPISGTMTATVAAGKNDFCIYGKNAGEYFIIENRQQQKRDTSLPDAGLAVWHVDELGSNNNEQMTPTQHYECALEQADGRCDLEHNANAGDSDDLFSAPTKPSFSDTTTPNSKWWDGSVSGLTMNQISASGSTMTFTTAKGDENMSNIVGTWNIVGVDWGCTGSVSKAGPFTFNADGSWTYPYGGGRWTQVGDMAIWNFDRAAGLIYTAAVNASAMNGIMGYVGTGSKGCFYALRQPLPAASPEMTAAVAAAVAAVMGAKSESAVMGDAAIGPAQ